MGRGSRGILFFMILIAIILLIAYEHNIQNRASPRHASKEVDFQTWLLQREAAEKEKHLSDKAEKFDTMEPLKRWAYCRKHLSECLEIGMSESQVWHLLGDPMDKNRTTFSALGKQHISEQWVYAISDYWRVYVYLEDNELTAWQD